MTVANTDGKHQLYIGVGLDVGRSRQGKPNEDAVGTYALFCNDPLRLALKGLLFVLADGMGGAAGGAVASRIAVESIGLNYYKDDDPDVTASIRRAIDSANTEIYELGQADRTLQGLGTTMVVAVVRADSLFVANIGDSRAYLLRKSELFPLTLDHTIVQDQIREGLLPADAAATHPQRHALSRNLGSQPWAEPDCYSNTLLEGDALLLCSDGLWGVVRHDDLEWILENYTDEVAIQALIDLANTYGGPDNISAIVIHYTSAAEDTTESMKDPLYPGSTTQSEESNVPMGLPPQSIQPTQSAVLPIATKRLEHLTHIKLPWLLGSLTILSLLLVAFIFQGKFSPTRSVPLEVVSSADLTTGPRASTVPDTSAAPAGTALLTSLNEFLGTYSAEGGEKSVAISPDGEILALGTRENAVKLWRVKDGIELHTLAGHHGAILDLAFSPDGQILASSSVDGTVKLWGVKGGVVLRTLSGQKTRIWGVSFSADGQEIISASSDSIITWSVKDGTEMGTAPGQPANTPTGIQQSP